MSSLPATSEFTGRRRVRDWIGDRLLLVLTAGASLAAVVLIGLIAYKILHGAHLAFSAFGLSFVKSSAWDANHKLFGALPGLYGTTSIQNWCSSSCDSRTTREAMPQLYGD